MIDYCIIILINDADAGDNLMTPSSDCNSHISLLETKEHKAAMMISALVHIQLIGLVDGR